MHSFETDYFMYGSKLALCIGHIVTSSLARRKHGFNLLSSLLPISLSRSCVRSGPSLNHLSLEVQFIADLHQKHPRTAIAMSGVSLISSHKKREAALTVLAHFSKIRLQLCNLRISNASNTMTSAGKMSQDSLSPHSHSPSRYFQSIRQNRTNTG